MNSISSLTRSIKRPWMALLLKAAMLLPAVSSYAQDVPVPETAKGPGFPLHLEGGVGNTITEDRGDGIYVVHDGVYTTMFLVGTDGVILVDAPPTMGTPDAPVGPGANRTLLDEISLASGGLPIKHLIYSHQHLDHIGGAQAIQDAFPDVKIYAHPETTRLLEEAHARNPDDPRPLPKYDVKNLKNVQVGDQLVELQPGNAAHGPGDLVVWAPRQQVLMWVDIVFPGWVPFDRLQNSIDVGAWITAHDEIMKYPFETFVAGHTTRTGTKEDVLEGIEYMNALQSAAGQGLGVPFVDETTDSAFFSPDTADAFGLFEQFLERAADECVAVLEAGGWKSRLAGFEAFADENCEAMQNYMRIGS